MAVYYVAPASLGGSDANNGLSVGAPCLTLAHVAGLMASQDTLNIRSDGVAVYAETLTNVFPSGGGSWATATIIQAYPGDPTPVVKSAAGASLVWQFSARNYLWIKKLNLDGSNCTTADNGIIKITATNSSTFAHHIRLDGCEIQGCPAGSGVLITKSSLNIAGVTDSNEILNCYIHDNGNTTHHHDIYIESSFNLVRNCILGSTSGYAVQIYFSNAVARDGNSCSNNEVSGCVMTAAINGGTTINYGTGNLYFNDIIYNCGTSGGNGGVQLINGTGSNLIFNLTVNGNTGQGIYLDNTGPAGAPDSNTIKNCISTNNTGAEYADGGTNTVSNYNLTSDASGVGANTLINTNPLYMNAGAGDFHLHATSPAINAGTSTAPTVTVDFDGNIRPQGTAYDIGAFEYPAAAGGQPFFFEA